MGNGELTAYGRMFMLYKIILDCKKRCTSPTSMLLRQADTPQVLLQQIAEITQEDIRNEMGMRRKDLWDAQM